MLVEILKVWNRSHQPEQPTWPGTNHTTLHLCRVGPLPSVRLVLAAFSSPIHPQPPEQLSQGGGRGVCEECSGEEEEFFQLSLKWLQRNSLRQPYQSSRTDRIEFTQPGKEDILAPTPVLSLLMPQQPSMLLQAGNDLGQCTVPEQSWKTIISSWWLGKQEWISLQS